MLNLVLFLASAGLKIWGWIRGSMAKQLGHAEAENERHEIEEKRRRKRDAKDMDIRSATRYERRQRMRRFFRS